jgi:hypothetical protein
MEKLIWYNPDLEMYEMGAQMELSILQSSSKQPEAYSIIYELSELSEHLGEKIMQELNLARAELLQKIG